MERHFILPASIAAAVHLGLLFGFPHHRPTINLPPKPDPADEFRCRLTIDPPDNHDEESGGGGGSAEVPPHLPPPDQPSSKATFEVPIPDVPASPVRLGPITKLPNQPFGPDGPDGPFRPGPPKPIPSNFLDHRPTSRVQVAPIYPAAARADGRAGEVTVEFTVDESGRVLEPRVVQSTDPVFDEAAIRAAAQWRFAPGTVNNQVVRFRMALPFIFRLENE